MQAVIMAGGFGTRLRPLTCNIPKPMVPLMNRPIIGHIVQLLKKHAFDDIIVMLFFQPEIIREYLGDGSRFGVTIRYLLPEEDLGTAGCVKFAEEYISDTFLVISGDLLTDVDISAFHAFHRDNGSDATILLTRVANPLSFGIVITDAQHRITRFLEKPSWGEVFSDRINSGIYMFEPHVLKKMHTDTEYDFSKDVFPALLEEKANLLGYPGEGYWRDIGNLDEYLAVHQDCLSGKVSVKIDGDRRDGLVIGRDAAIGDRVEFIGNAVIGKNTRIEDGAYIQNSVIGDNSIIGKRARIISSVVWDSVTIGEESQTKNAVVSSQTHIGGSSVISDKVFIGEEVSIGDGTLIKPQVKIWPKKTIASDTILSTSVVWGDRWLRELFTDARVSGIVNMEITPEFAARLGSALGAFWRIGGSIYSSRDNDNASYMITNALQSGLNAMGVNVEDLAHTPIPVVRQVLRGSNFKGGVHVRKSPYDEKDVDIILFDSDGLDLHTNKCKKVERLFFAEDYARIGGSLVGTKDYTVRPIEIYRKNFLSSIDREAFKKRKLKVVMDFSYGPASTIFPTIFSELDVDLITLNAYLNPSFLSVSNEERQKQFRQLSSIVKSVGGDAGFIIDSTCERLFLVDNLGRPFSGVELLLIVTKLFLQQHKPQYIASPINAPFLMRKMAEKQGVGYLSCMSSHRSMIETAIQDGVGFVGGTVGGFIFTDFGRASDAMYASVKLLEMMSRLKGPLGALIDTLPFPNIVSRDIACSWDEKGKVMGALMSVTENMKRELIHGVKIFGDNYWILLLPARDEPLFTVTAEAATREKAGELVDEWAEKIKGWLDQ